MPTLFVQCQGCHLEIPTPLAEPVAGGAPVLVSSMRVRCPTCAHEGEYSTADLHVPTGIDGPPAGNLSMAEENLENEHASKLRGAQEKIVGYGVVPPEGRSTHEG
jgi:hypothetical protein